MGPVEELGAAAQIAEVKNRHGRHQLPINFRRRIAAEKIRLG
jgi:hypothetical protein